MKKIFKIEMLVNSKVAIDGVHVKDFKAGVQYDVDEDLFNSLKAMGHCELVDEKKSAKKSKKPVEEDKSEQPVEEDKVDTDAELVEEKKPKKKTKKS